MTIRLSKQTIQILKNFAHIEEMIKIHPGSMLYTKSYPAGSVFATAQIEEEIPVEANIYNLNQFLSTLALFDDPEILFEEDQAVIRHGRQKVTYRFAEPEIVPDAKKSLIQLSTVFSASISEDVFSRINKIASVLSVPKMQVQASHGTVFLKIADPKKMISNVFEMEIGETDASFNYAIPVENIKTLPGQYSLAVLDRPAIRLSHEDLPIQYLFAAERL